MPMQPKNVKGIQIQSPTRTSVPSAPNILGPMLSQIFDRRAAARRQQQGFANQIQMQQMRDASGLEQATKMAELKERMRQAQLAADRTRNAAYAAQRPDGTMPTAVEALDARLRGGETGSAAPAAAANRSLETSNRAAVDAERRHREEIYKFGGAINAPGKIIMPGGEVVEKGALFHPPGAELNARKITAELGSLNRKEGALEQHAAQHGGQYPEDYEVKEQYRGFAAGDRREDAREQGVVSSEGVTLEELADQEARRSVKDKELDRTWVKFLRGDQAKDIQSKREAMNDFAIAHGMSVESAQFKDMWDTMSRKKEQWDQAREKWTAEKEDRTREKSVREEMTALAQIHFPDIQNHEALQFLFMMEQGMDAGDRAAVRKQDRLRTDRLLRQFAQVEGVSEDTVRMMQENAVPYFAAVDAKRRDEFEKDYAEELSETLKELLPYWGDDVTRGDLAGYMAAGEAWVRMHADADVRFRREAFEKGTGKSPGSAQGKQDVREYQRGVDFETSLRLLTAGPPTPENPEGTPGMSPGEMDALMTTLDISAKKVRAKGGVKAENLYEDLWKAWLAAVKSDRKDGAAGAPAQAIMQALKQLDPTAGLVRNALLKTRSFMGVTVPWTSKHGLLPNMPKLSKKIGSAGGAMPAAGGTGDTKTGGLDPVP